MAVYLPSFYSTGFTGSPGFSFLFSQFPDETEKEESCCAGEIKAGLLFLDRVFQHLPPIS